MWLVAILTVLGLLTSLLLKRTHGGADKLPPLRSGWLPWLGCALEFGKEPLNFIKRIRDEVT